ncbi:hypothetical protein PV10_04260 [Exophiala mesophila]|uniref:HSF-type DNA-binding domain-containing protein n=1 Tax=Exophiala mesophila TaxID=212818 RepID=A0A0D1WUU1_EXOME|nr:uncharacterized protein PV10_04260 [Exophiala mesophila]KIV93015.1 hypothetical protein PV10_04260 [Exophiala mesophila]
MTSQGLSRKRPAPGTSPTNYPQQVPPQNTNPIPPYNSGLDANLSNEQFLQWGQGAHQLPAFNDNSYASNSSTFPQPSQQSSTQLTRLPMGQLAPRNRSGDEPSGWFDQTGAQGPDADWSNSIAELEAKAQIAKKEAQAKRKQIPPFVQKLNSFLEDGRNTDLIRWADDGNSFIVVDEEDFAKTLIPELFKHNNYASFVRQLNMYGFHKKVGLSDNSMRASERKNKSPSEYSNPYFRRGCPDLLWLIQKPKNLSSGSSKRKGKSDNDANEEDGDEAVDEVINTTDSRARTRPGQLALGSMESSLTQEQFSSVQRELQAIRHQQSQISRMMQALKREHEQLYGQAATFQDQHTRHENSINAILTFLATVYNRSLQGHDAVPGIANMFTNGMPVDTSQGNVVDVGDFSFDHLESPDSGLSKPFRKQPLLLTDGVQHGRASTISPRPSNSPYTQRARLAGQNVRPAQQSVLSPNVEEVFDPGVNSPNSIPQQASSVQAATLPQRDMMSVIQNTNARNSSASPSTPVQDFNTVLNSLESSGGTGPLSNSQRADVLRMINQSARQPSGSDNALINSTPPPGPTNFQRRLASTNADLDQLAKLQAEQDKSVQNLTNLLQPLSPTGSIPGINDGQSLPPPPLDIDDFLSHNEYFTDFPSDGNGNYEFGSTGLPNANQGTDGLDFLNYKDDDELFGNVNDPQNKSGVNFDFGADGTADVKYPDEVEEGGRVESVPSSEVTTPNSASSETPYNKSKGRKLSGTMDRSEQKKRRRS